MDRRKKRTSTSQYMHYIDLMQRDSIFATGRVPRDVDSNYLQKKWKDLSDKLNTCSSGPTLTADEWRKRLNDWKNTTRAKYRRSLSGEKDIAMTSLELKALDLFGKMPNTSSDTLSIHLKSEKEDSDETEHQRTSESFQKELQAAVEEAIGGDDEEEDITDDHEDQEELLTEQLTTNTQSVGGVGPTTTTYRTIVVENANFTDEDQTDEHYEYITERRLPHGATSSGAATVATGVQTVVSAAPTTTVTKLINGENKRLRSSNADQIVYEVKKAAISQSHPQRTITLHNSGATVAATAVHTTHAQPHNQTTHTVVSGSSGGGHVAAAAAVFTAQDSREIARQLKRLADIKSEKLKFEIARFKFNNPGFQHNYPHL